MEFEFGARSGTARGALASQAHKSELERFQEVTEYGKPRGNVELDVLSGGDKICVWNGIVQNGCCEQVERKLFK